jgi:hypothetical protein
MHGGFGYHSMWSNIPKEIDDADIPAIRKELGIEAAIGLQDNAN